MASGPLHGVRILEFAQVYAGPFAGMLLADMGATVIKVEPFEGDPWRHHRSFAPFESAGFHSVNRGKKSLAIDLKHPRAPAVIERLLPACDVIISNLRPDVPERLGIDYERVRRARPDIIYGLATAWGREGEAALEPAFDLVVQAASGLMASAGRMSPRGTPVAPGGAPYVDFLTGYSLSLAVCAALFHRARTGEGQFLETSMLVNALMIQNPWFAHVPAADQGRREALRAQTRAMIERGAPFSEQIAARVGSVDSELASPFYRVYMTSDGAIAVGGLSPQFRKRMRLALGLGEEQRAPERGSTSDRELALHIEGLIRVQPSEHWMRVFRQADVPVTEVQFVDQLDQHPQVRSNGYTVELHHETSGREVQVAPVHKMSATPPQAQGASPRLGAHTREVLALASYAEEEITALFDAQVVR